MAIIIPQKLGGIKSELFRFVNLRPPLKKTQLVPTGIPYVPSKFEKNKKTLYSSYLETTAGSDPKKQFVQGRALIQKFKSGTGYYATVQEVEQAYPNFLALKSWLETSGTTDVKTVKEQVEKQLGRKGNDVLQDLKAEALAWDNYFVNVGGQDNPDVLQSLTDVLRIYHLAQQLQKNEKANVRRLLKAPVLLPADLFPEPDPEELPAAEPAATDKTAAMNALSERIAQLNAAKEDLERKRSDYMEAQEKKRGGGSTEEPQEIAGKIPAKLWDSLEKSTAATLSGLNIRSGGNYLAALETIGRELERTHVAFLPYTSKGKTVALIGHTLVEFDDHGVPPAAAPKAAQKQGGVKSGNVDDDPFLPIYSCIFANNKDLRLNISIGDFKRVEQETKCYEAGEVAHIENVLRGEEKDHVSRRLVRTEETVTHETEATEETERDVQTAERFEMEKTVDNVIKADMSLEAGVTMTAKYGEFLSVSANAAFATSLSTQSSTHNAIEYAKNVTDRARNKVVKTVKDSRTTKTLVEFEDTNTHKLKGAEDEHTVGIYRWVDKVYKARLINYGKRMMLRFDIPEPSAYHIYAKQSASLAAINMVTMPKHPSRQVINQSSLHSFYDITESNYAAWAALYEAQVPPPPKKRILVGVGITAHLGAAVGEDGRQNPRINEHNNGREDGLVIPAGYSGRRVFVHLGMEMDPLRHAWQPQANVFIGTNDFWFHADQPATWQSNYRTQVRDWTDNFYTGVPEHLSYEGLQENKVPITYKGRNCHMLNINIVLECERSAQAMLNWQMQVYNTIMDAYNDLLTKAEQAVNQLRVYAGVEIAGSNPLTNQQTIRTELKKSSIEMLRVYNRPLLTHSLPHVEDASFTSMGGAWGERPFIRNPFSAIREGKYINFVEDCFEWDQMTYRLHPYYWARSERWNELYRLADPDPLFQSFLRAGSASVVVPVQPGYERHLLYFIRTGKLWLGADAPLIDAALDQYIEDELGDVDPQAPPVVEACWDLKLPTNLVILQEDANGIPGEGLPCFDVTCEG